MRFTADRKALAKAVKDVIVPPVNTHITVLHGIHIEADRKAGVVTFTSSNLDLTCTEDVRADVDNGGVAIVPAKVLGAFLNNGPADLVTFELGDGTLTATCGESVVTLRTHDVEHWPKALTVTGDAVVLSVADVRRIGSVLFAADPDRTQPILNKVHFHDHHAEATDRYQLAIASLEATLPDVCVPIEVVRRVVAGTDEDVVLTVDDRHACFASGDRTWTSTIAALDFPTVDRLIVEKQPVKFRFTTGELVDALKRMRLLDEDDPKKDRVVILTPDGGKVLLSHKVQDVGEVADMVPCTIDGEPPTRLAVGLAYFTELVAEHDEETITVELTDALKPLQVRTSDARHVSLLMPVRVS